MKPTTRYSTVTIVFLFLLVFCVVGMNVVDSSGYTDLSDLASFPSTIFSVMSWNKFPIQFPLRLGLSVLLLFIVYLGGRSKNKRFHDLIPGIVILSIAVLFKTALTRAVFIFLVFGFRQMRQAIIQAIRVLLESPNRRLQPIMCTVICTSLKY